MNNKPNKIQVYLDDQTYQKITNLAKAASLSRSKYVANVLESHTPHQQDDERFQLKTQAILSHILSAVYDYDISKKNADEVKSLLGAIDQQVSDKLTTA
jgi:hypothetical protein